MNKRELKQRIRDGKARAKAEGRPCGPPPYGKAGPAEKEILDRVVFWRTSNGSGTPRKSYSEIAKELNATGNFTRFGHHWTRQRILLAYRRADHGAKKC